MLKHSKWALFVLSVLVASLIVFDLGMSLGASCPPQQAIGEEKHAPNAAPKRCSIEKSATYGAIRSFVEFVEHGEKFFIAFCTLVIAIFTVVLVVATAFLMSATNRTGGRSFSDTSRVLSFERGLMASKARKRLGFALAPYSMVKRGSVEPANGDAAPGPTEHAMIEAAIQLDLITPKQAEALVEKGKTLGEWLLEQETDEAGEPRRVTQRMLDALGVVALILFNLVALVGLWWIVLRVLRSL
jgi:hypothetical protein